ncbi:MAG: hypothetical protein QOE82_883 [Thermoanaerobaculia bacterium]|jgi:hypothetical protein|nr:hypothetical protein [Thermoanaerobaculia bacterium]
MDPLTVDKDFNLLSLKDLLEARDFYHVHLMHKRNVVASALGRYLIRKDDPWPTGERRKKEHDKFVAKAPRRLDNSEVRPYSWPCILVFVKEWIPTGHFGDKRRNIGHDEMVPDTLYMPDGRAVPVCVVESPLQERTHVDATDWIYPSNMIGGGYPIIADVQGEEHIGSIGCLVSDGHFVYALTNRHVCGEEGEELSTLLNDAKVVVGKSTKKQLTRLPFEEVYQTWPGKNVWVNLDVGLIEIEEKAKWTAQVYGVGAMDEIADLSINNISLRLIGCPVRAYGAASKQMKGAIRALFYRYKSLGGFEYVSDFLIGPRGGQSDAEPFATHHGDSGTVWMMETDPGDGYPAELRPIAVQWGGHEFVSEGKSKTAPHALATCLSTICNLLDVDVIRDWNIGQLPYWGAVGHYAIAALAIDAIRTQALHALMNANLENISFAPDDIEKSTVTGLSKNEFVQLADVPDLVWKPGQNRPFSRGNPERWNHFADMDHPSPDGTLLEICEDPANINPARWLAYYAEVKKENPDENEGVLPFRIQQIYEAMVDFAKAGKNAEFVCAGGILSHYVGDACQPLHISYMFDGDPAEAETQKKKDPFTGKMVDVEVPLAHGVHTAYEDTMIDFHAAEVKEGMKKAIQKGKAKPLPLIKGGRAAREAAVELMRSTFNTITPAEIIAEYRKAQKKGLKPKPAANALWDAFGTKTINLVSTGSRYLAMLWDSAWKEGGGKSAKATTFTHAKLIAIYSKKTFLPSLTLKRIGEVLKEK